MTTLSPKVLPLIAACICAFSIVIPFRALAQSPKALDNNDVIKIRVDENGKITNIPTGFQLREGRKYNYVIEVAPPDKQEKALIKYFKEQLLSVYHRFQNPTDSATVIFKKLYEDDDHFKAYNQEFKNLYDLLDDDPAKAQTNLKKDSIPRFTYLNGRIFLLKVLFDEVNVITVNVGDSSASATQAYNQTVTLKLTDMPPIDRRNLLIRVTDLKKKFLIAYYTESLKNSTFSTFLEKVSPDQFYNKVIKADLNNILKNKNEILKMIADPKAPLEVCNPAVKAKLDELKKSYDQNDLVALVKSDWLKKWMWYTNGELKLNPFDFTDAGKLDLPDGFDKARAAEMNEYVKKSMERLKADGSEDRISIALFDSLNRQSGNGKDLYTFEKVNTLAKKANQDKFNAFQQGKKLIDSLTFLVAASKPGPDIYVKSFNAAQALVKSPQDDAVALPLDTRIQVMAYNVMSADTFKVTSKDVSITDESAASKNVGDVATGLSTAFSQAAIAAPLVQSITKGFSQDYKNTVQLAILPEANKRDAFHGAPDESVHQYRLDFKISGGKVGTELVVDGDELPLNKDVSDRVSGLLKKYFPQDCQNRIGQIWKSITTRLSVRALVYKGTADDFEDKQKQYYKDLNEQLNSLINAELTKIAAENAELVKQGDPLLEVAAYMVSHGNYLLPPKKLSLQDAPGKPTYVTSYKELEQKTAATLINLSLTYASKGKGSYTRLDQIKQATPHWISASLGVAYVFDKFNRNDVSITNGVLTQSMDEDQVRLLAGINIYPKPIIYVDDRFIGRLRGWDLLSRFSVFVGCSFPKPLYNPHLGLSIEPWPSIKLTYGWHWYRKTDYTIVNDQIADQHYRYYYNSPFVSLTFDPVKFVALISSIKL